MRRTLWQDRSGVAALEAGITLGVLLVPLLAGLVGVGQALMLQYRLDRATHFGLLYAWGAPTAAATTSNVVSAAQAGYGTAAAANPAATITAATSCYCLDPTGTRTSSTSTLVTCPSSGIGTCTNANQVMGRWITVSSTASFTPVLVGSWGGAAWTLQNTSTVRIQ